MDFTPRDKGKWCVLSSSAQAVWLFSLPVPAVFKEPTFSLPSWTHRVVRPGTQIAAAQTPGTVINNSALCQTWIPGKHS